MAEQAQDILEEILQESERERRLFGFDAATNAALRGVADMEEAALGAHATKNSEALRKFDRKNEYDILRGPFAIDTDKILHNALYNRYIDKTQVFSFYKNDDITRRSTHVQLVSRIARTIGRALRLNLDLIEAIAVGHDIGHTPFGHRGEQYLSDLYLQSDRHRYFNHNVHSVRVLKTITKTNLTLQTLDGILCHNGEDEFIEYRPSGLNSFEAFEQNVEQCYTDKAFIKTLPHQRHDRLYLERQAGRKEAGPDKRRFFHPDHTGRQQHRISQQHCDKPCKKQHGCGLPAHGP